MYFDRWDICAAYWQFLKNFPYCKGYRKYNSKLLKLGYKPGLGDNDLKTLSPNSKLIYMRLVRDTFFNP